MNAAAAEPLIGVINAGSSSLKFSFYEGEARILTGQVDGIGAHPSATAAGPNGEKNRTSGSRYKAARWTERGPPGDIAMGERKARLPAACGTRPPWFVHGGLNHSRPARVSPELLASSRRWCRSRRCMSHIILLRSKWQ